PPPPGDPPGVSPESEELVLGPVAERPSPPRLIQRALLRGAALLASLGLGRDLPSAPRDPPVPALLVELCEEEEEEPAKVPIDLALEGDRQALPPLWTQTPPRSPRRREEEEEEERQRRRSSRAPRLGGLLPSPASPRSPRSPVPQAGLISRPRPSPVRSRIDPWSFVSAGPRASPAQSPQPEPRHRPPSLRPNGIDPFAPQPEPLLPLDPFAAAPGWASPGGQLSPYPSPPPLRAPRLPDAKEEPDPVPWWGAVLPQDSSSSKGVPK
uniref:Mitogen-activated protein kinase kinase kinase 11 n=1 Tax=Sphenodon punctatus TaxID=8508 RepID=A0A8D0GZK3_SPHPU